MLCFLLICHVDTMIQDYTFESKQFLQIIVLDVDDERNLPTKYVKDADETDLLGRVECLLSEVVGARNSTFDKDMTGNRAGRKYGRIRVQSEELAESARVGDTLVLRMQGQALAAKDGAPNLDSRAARPMSGFATKGVRAAPEFTPLAHSRPEARCSPAEA